MPLLLAGLCLSLAAGCGDDGDEGASAAPPLRGAIKTDDPAHTFAPIVYQHPDERYLPLSAKAFVMASTLYFGEDLGCPEHRVAKGERELPRLTEEPTYSVRPFEGADCRRRSERAYGAEEVTRPHENTPARVQGLRPEEGFYLDLDDSQRGGAPASTLAVQSELHGAAAWYEKHPERVAGGPGMRVTHWLVYGMHAPRRADGRPLATMTHEGDWERIDVLLRGQGRRWKPFAVVTYDPRGRPTETPWTELRREAARYPSSDFDRGRVHPVLFGALGTHTFRVRPGNRTEREVDLIGRPSRIRDVSRGPCRACPRMETALPGFSLDSQYWYGFGGAWGERGLTTLMTGPLGPRPD